MEKSSTIVPILQLGKLKYREVSNLPKVCQLYPSKAEKNKISCPSSHKCQSQDLNPKVRFQSSRAWHTAFCHLSVTCLFCEQTQSDPHCPNQDETLSTARGVLQPQKLSLEVTSNYRAICQVFHVVVWVEHPVITRTPISVTILPLQNALISIISWVLTALSLLPFYTHRNRLYKVAQLWVSPPSPLSPGLSHSLGKCCPLEPLLPHLLSFSSSPFHFIPFYWIR